MKNAEKCNFVATQFRVVDGPDAGEIQKVYNELLQTGGCGQTLAFSFKVVLMARLWRKTGNMGQQPENVKLWRPLWQKPVNAVLMFLRDEGSTNLGQKNLSDINASVMIEFCDMQTEFMADITENCLDGCVTLESNQPCRLYYNAKTRCGALKIPDEPAGLGENRIEIKPWPAFRKFERPSMNKQALYALSRFRNSEPLNDLCTQVQENLRLFGNNETLKFIHDNPRVEIAPYPVVILKSGDVRKIGKGCLLRLELLAAKHKSTFEVDEMALAHIGRKTYGKDYYEPCNHYQFLAKLTKDVIEEYSSNGKPKSKPEDGDDADERAVQGRQPQYGYFVPERHLAGTLVTIDYDLHNRYGVVMFHDHERGSEDYFKLTF